MINFIEPIILHDLLYTFYLSFDFGDYFPTIDCSCDNVFSPFLTRGKIDEIKNLFAVIYKRKKERIREKR